MKDAEKDVREARDLKFETVEPDRKSRMLRRASYIGAIALAAFLLGFLPMWLSSRSYRNERDAVQAQMRPRVLQNDLATAALYARRGEYESARQRTSDFFTTLRDELDSEQSVLNEQQREAARQIFASRDEIITLLARNDAAAADRLSEMYFTFTDAKSSTPEDAKKK